MVATQIFSEFSPRKKLGEDHIPIFDGCIFFSNGLGWNHQPTWCWTVFGDLALVTWQLHHPLTTRIRRMTPWLWKPRPHRRSWRRLGPGWNAHETPTDLGSTFPWSMDVIQVYFLVIFCHAWWDDACISCNHLVLQKDVSGVQNPLKAYIKWLMVLSIYRVIRRVIASQIDPNSSRLYATFFTLQADC